LQFFSGILNGGVVKSGCVTAGGCYSDVMRCSSTNYRQTHVLRAATEQRQLYKDDKAPFVAIILRFHGISNLKEVLEPRLSGLV